MHIPITKGAHHIGLTVSKLEQSASFFTSILGWKEVRRNDEYPAIFVTDDSIMITLWQTKEEPSNQFNRKKNVGLHHVAFRVQKERDLERIHEKLIKSGIEIKFSPELLKDGPAKHMMCYDPSGIRIEFIWPGN